MQEKYPIKKLLVLYQEKSIRLFYLKKYKHKTNINVFEYKIKILDPQKEVFINAFDKMIDNSINDFPNGRIKKVPIHEIIKTKQRLAYKSI